jgi:hypothetical protein
MDPQSLSLTTDLDLRMNLARQYMPEETRPKSLAWRWRNRRAIALGPVDKSLRPAASGIKGMVTPTAL